MTPESIAKRLGLEYLRTDVNWFDGYGEPSWTKEFYWFNDPETGTTIGVYELSKLESKLKE